MRTIRDEDPSDDPGVAFEGVTALALAESGKAIKVQLKDGRVLWVPNSQVHDNSEIYAEGKVIKGSPGTLVLTTWIAEQKGLVKP